jgi:hypothetical protein
MDLKEIGSQGVDWIHLVQRRALVNIVSTEPRDSIQDVD